MRSRVLIALFCALAFACSKSEKRAASPCDAEPLAGLVAQHPIHVLCGAADVVPEARIVADSALGDWDSFEPGHLVDRVDPVKLERGTEQLCALLKGMPPDAGNAASAGIASWVETSFAIDRTQGESGSVEFFASAVAGVPEVRGAVPEGAIQRIPEGHMVGDTMASGEFTMMNYELAHILSRMPGAERDRILEEVRAKAVELMNREM